jgi:phenylacetic acid degradation protein
MKPQVYDFEGVVPVIDPSAYVHPSAVLIGDVWIGAGCYVGAGAVFRGDFGRIELHEDANVQTTVWFIRCPILTVSWSDAAIWVTAL